MKIAGIAKSSFVDWPGMLSAVIFAPGCNLNCFYCHNRQLVPGDASTLSMAPGAVLEWLSTRQGLLDGVVISGGEPTLQRDLPDFIRAVRAVGFPVKLDTNGTRPETLASLVHEGLLDYVAMDVKAPQEKYEAITGVPADHDAINASIDCLLEGRVDYEFRTTVAPQLTAADIVAITRRIRGARYYVLQQYRRPDVDPASADPRLSDPSHSAGWALRVIEAIGDIVQRVDTRGFGVGEPAARSTAA